MEIDPPTREIVAQMFGRAPVYDAIFSCLTPLALARMASVNRNIRMGVKDFQERAYNINKLLQHFFDDPLAFRSLMACTHLVISGSFALQFFDRSFYYHSDLDLYVHPNNSIVDIGRHLVQEGYSFIPFSWQQPDYATEVERILADIDISPTWENTDEEELDALYELSKSVRAVHVFQRATENGVRTAQVIVSRVSPFVSILEFHSSEKLSFTFRAFITD